MIEVKTLLQTELCKVIPVVIENKEIGRQTGINWHVDKICSRGGFSRKWECIKERVASD